MALLIAGERPRVKEREPFGSKAGTFFREILTAVRITKVRFCYPETSEDLWREISSEEHQFIVLSGNRVLQLVHPELRTGQCHGRITSSGDRLFMPVFHHEAIVRMPKEFRPVVEQELAVLRAVAGDRANWLNYLQKSCVKCREPGYRTTPERVTYCQQHWLRAG